MRKDKIYCMKKIFLFIVLILLIGACGCAMKPNNQTSRTNRSQSEQEIVSAIKEHLSQKYGSFNYQVEGFIKAGWDHDYDLLNLSVEINGTKETFSVQRHSTESGYVYEDNYFGLLVRPNFEEKVSELAADYFASMNVYVTLSQNYPDNLTNAAQIDDLLALDNLQNISVIVTVEENFNSVEEFTAAAKLFVSKWTDQRIPSTVRVIYLNKEVFANTNRSNVSSVLVNNQLAEYREIVKKVIIHD